ncbi:hypothetical protein [Cupriavidus sp. D39]|uniref:hypothetical protein n=1 Tax=Cupriavidus sp. D39 TaxID=2997877 RepID=UPI002271B0C8|nr:hypothetical protein [Cupriavidus sp. D39]MCY0858727.1 hypothetical protein [Cupriavidus sp. D39]
MDSLASITPVVSWGLYTDISPGKASSLLANTAAAGVMITMQQRIWAISGQTEMISRKRKACHAGTGHM